tara:strand:- start:511 stop:786 length:276 start_codon:yes stop_codon:yes gene_type:complete
MSYNIPESGIYEITCGSNIKEASFEYDIFEIVFSRKTLNFERKWYQFWKPKYSIENGYIYNRTETDKNISLKNGFIIVPRILYGEINVSRW